MLLSADRISHWLLLYQGVTELRNYCEFSPVAPIPLKEQFPAASAGAVSLLSALLQYNPAKRISAEEVAMVGC